MESVYRTMAEAENLDEMLSILTRTRLQDGTEGVTGEEPEEIERALVRDEIRRIRLIREKSHRYIVEFVTLFLERYDGERLKVLLRYWHRGAGNGERFSGEKILYDFPVTAILSAGTLNDVIALLEATPFQKVLAEALSEYQDTKTLFPLELAIDRFVFNRLWNATEFLRKNDRRIARRLLGIEIDLRNIDWIGRMRSYYNLSEAEIGERVLPHGHRIDSEDIRRMASGNDVSQALKKVISDTRLTPQFGQESGIGPKDLEYLLYQVLLSEARKAFGEFPFTIGSILGYFILLRIETRNVRMLIQAKQYGLSSEKTMALLIA
jgi:V/A-type H+-transporting ATPase subunit C